MLLTIMSFTAQLPSYWLLLSLFLSMLIPTQKLCIPVAIFGQSLSGSMALYLADLF